MSDEQGYNGWKNYETWCMALWIDNDEGSYNYSRELRDELLELDGDDFMVVTYADSLKAWQFDQMPDVPASVWSDLLGAAFSEVDWYEIADNYLTEVDAA